MVTTIRIPVSSEDLAKMRGLMDELERLGEEREQFLAELDAKVFRANRELRALQEATAEKAAEAGDA